MKDYAEAGVSILWPCERGGSWRKDPPDSLEGWVGSRRRTLRIRDNGWHHNKKCWLVNSELVMEAEPGVCNSIKGLQRVQV